MFRPTSTSRHYVATCILSLLSAGFTFASTQTEKGLNPYTGYFVLGRTPPRFAVIKYVEFRKAEGERAGVPEGFMVTDLSDPERGLLGLTKIVMRGRELAFETEERLGVVYRFEGRFLRGGDLRRFSRQQEVAVLAGAVSKYRNGRRVARGRIKFYCVADAG